MLGTNYICSVLLKTNLVQILHTYTIEKNMAFTSASWGKCQPFKYNNLSVEAYFIYTFYYSYQYYNVAVNKINNMGGVPILCIQNPNDIGMIIYYRIQALCAGLNSLKTNTLFQFSGICEKWFYFFYQVIILLTRRNQLRYMTKLCGG